MVDTYANCFVKRDRPSSTIEEVEKDKDKRRDKGLETPKHPVDYSKITQADKEEVNV